MLSTIDFGSAYKGPSLGVVALMYTAVAIAFAASVKVSGARLPA